MSRLTITKEEKHRIQIFFDHQPQAKIVAQEAEANDTSLRNDPIYLSCLSQLQRMVGIEKVKRFMHEIFAWLEISKKREQVGLLTEQQVLHMVFTGNPGTGKTSVARILAQLFNKMGVLSKGHLVEVERADLVGEYIGHTAHRTREHIKQAQGGILFIDEAYALARGGDKDFGKEAIDTLVKAMEDHKNDFILILAGYSVEMETFLNSNPGLPSRFPIKLQFPDFTIAQLMEIAEQMVEERQYHLTTIAREKLEDHLIQIKSHNQCDFGNARYVRNVLEKSIRQQAVRLLHHEAPQRDDLMSIYAKDLPFELIT